MNEKTNALLSRARRRYDDWFRQQTKTRLAIFCAGYIASVGLFAWLCYMLTHPPHDLAWNDVVAFGLCEAAFFVLWPLLTLKFKRNGHNITAARLFCWWAVTLWLCVFVTVAHTNAAPVASGAVTIQQSAGTGNTNTVQPAVINCSLWLVLFFLLVAGLFFAMFLYMLCKLGFCGNTGNPPPQSPGNAGNSVVQKASVNSALPVTTFYLQNGVCVSNSACLPDADFPPLLSLGGLPIANGTQISTLTPGITTPPSIALWKETNTWFDANLDPTHAYAGVYNYTLLTKTNLAEPWRELCTVVGWVNSNPAVPLIASITYTNGVPMTTNWYQCYLDRSMLPTNVVVYGALPSFNISNPASRFYMLTANTNAISTSWP